jgi:hypothetical protein
MKFIPVRDRGDHQDYINGSYAFLDQDSREKYKKNLKRQPQNWKYRNKVVTYKLNSEFYRTLEFEKIRWEESIVIFGCSNVFGLGAALDETLPAQLSKLTGIPTINMGVCGSSAHHALYNSAILKQMYPKPRAVVFGWTSAERCTLFRYTQDKTSFIVENCGAWTEDSSDLGKAWFKYNSNVHVHTQLTRIVAQQLWSDTKYADYTSFPSNMRFIPDCKYFRIIDHGRDCSHPGEKTNLEIAKYIASELNL